MAKSSTDRLKKWFKRVRKDTEIDYYGLLGLGLFEDDVQTIEQATEERLELLQKLSNAGLEVKVAKRLMERIVKAKICLTNTRRRLEYDRQLKQGLSSSQSSATENYEDSESRVSQAEKHTATKESRTTQSSTIDRKSSSAKLARSKIKKEKKKADSSKAIGIVLGLICCVSGLAVAAYYVNFALSYEPPQKVADGRLVPDPAEKLESDQEPSTKKQAEQGPNQAGTEATQTETAKKTAAGQQKTDDSEKALIGDKTSDDDSLNENSKPESNQNLNDDAIVNGNSEQSSNDPNGIAKLLGDAEPKKTNEEPDSGSAAKKNLNSRPVKKVANNKSFDGFVPYVELPALNQTQPIKINDLVISSRFLMGATLIFEPLWSRNKISFSIKRSTDDKQTWNVLKQNRSDAEPVNVGRFWRDDSAFRFQWNAAAANDEYVNYLRNGALKLSTPDGQETTLSLRKPVKIQGFKFGKDHDEVEVKSEISWLPTPKAVTVEVLGFDPNQIPSHCIPEFASRIPAKMFFSRTEQNVLVWMEVTALTKSQTCDLSAKLMINPHAPTRFQQAILDAAHDVAQNRVETLKSKIPKDKQGNNKELKIARTQFGVVTEYRMMIPKLVNRNIPIRVYLQSGGHRVVLAHSPGLKF